MREPKLGVAVGKKGVGKTYITTKMINSYVRGNPSKGVKPRRALVLDVNDEFVEYKALRLKDVAKFSAHPKIEARRIRPFNDDGVRMTLKEIQDALFSILNDYRGGLLLIEDINRYISDHLPNDLVGAICTNRHTDTDIIMHFQSIGRVTSKIWQNINWLRFHKNTDSVDRHIKKFEDKFEYLKIAEMMINKQYYNGNERFFLFVDIDAEKILGDFDKSLLNEAIDDYIEKYYRKIIAPMLKQRDLKGKVKYNQASAVNFVRDRIIKNYCT
jgi:hypothetical protein|tara:strand:+ start:3581 stop:4393 length:813 start_codon:yes stop_codon:yes gene_type:complete